MSWQEVSLAGVSESVSYGLTASASEDQVGPKFLRITDIVPECLDWGSVPYCKASERDQNRFSLEVGDIVVARTGATVGYAKQIRDVQNAVFASYLVRFRVDSEVADPYFVGCLVESTTYKRYVKSQVGGSAQPNANAKVLGRFKFKLPPRSSQSRIASFLSAYDDLIENNRRRIALLEEAARLLYREWFVHFRFPGHEHVKIADGLPEGWERRTLGAVLNLQRGFDLPVSMRIAGGVPVYGSTGIVGEHNVAKVSFPTLVTGRSGSLGKVCFVDDPCWPLNTSLWVTEFKEVSILFAYFVLSEMDLAKFNAGASVPTLDRKVAHGARILIPSRNVATLFDEQMVVFFRQKKLLNQQIQKLAQARDLLLPRLVKGEITV